MFLAANRRGSERTPRLTATIAIAGCRTARLRRGCPAPRSSSSPTTPCSQTWRFRPKSRACNSLKSSSSKTGPSTVVSSSPSQTFLFSRDIKNGTSYQAIKLCVCSLLSKAFERRKRFQLRGHENESIDHNDAKGTKELDKFKVGRVYLARPRMKIQIG